MYMGKDLTKKSSGSSVFAFLQKLGRSLMLPIAILPIAGLLLRLGQPDLLNFAPIAKAGDAIFGNLPLIFAIGVAVGWAKENHGAAALAAFVGFQVMSASAPEFAQIFWDNPEGTDMAVLGGILVGLVAGSLYNKFYRTKLPPYLAFFGGRRSVPIVTGFAALGLGLFAALVWPTIGGWFDSFGAWVIQSGPIGKFFYGILNRLLIVTGLHHVFNTPLWFQFGEFTNAAGEVVTGDIARFMAGDPTAGGFMAGFFPIMMFGLPAAALAMYSTALPKNKKRAAGILMSAALTAFLTGVTEPLEFSFMFLAPVLYGIHAVLTGLSLALMDILGVKLGFTFSAGLFDYVLNFGIATKPLLGLLVGLGFFVLYFVLFRFFILKFNIKTIGREDEITNAEVNVPSAASAGLSNTPAGKYIAALGDVGNIVEIDNCATRLRLKVNDASLVNDAAVTALGARGILKPSAHAVQVIIGPEVELLAGDMKDEWKAAGGPSASQKGVDFSQEKETNVLRPSSQDVSVAEYCLKAFGGTNNITKAEVAAGTRVMVTLAREITPDIATLKAAGIDTVQVKGLNALISVGERAPFVAQSMSDRL